MGLRLFDVQEFAVKHAAKIAATGQTLAINYDIPAQRIINALFESIGEPRFVGKDDRWEQIIACQNGWEYRPPPKSSIDRWRMA